MYMKCVMGKRFMDVKVLFFGDIGARYGDLSL